MAAKQEPSGVDGKYYGLNNRLRGVWASEWKTCFTEIERIIGSSLPPSARRDRGWWGNEESGSQQAQALAWLDAGWETVEVDLKAETLVFKRKHKFDLNEVWPAISTGEWPEGLSLRREDIYEDRV